MPNTAYHSILEVKSQRTSFAF